MRQKYLRADADVGVNIANPPPLSGVRFVDLRFEHRLQVRLLQMFQTTDHFGILKEAGRFLEAEQVAIELLDECVAASIESRRRVAQPPAIDVGHLQESQSLRQSCLGTGFRKVGRSRICVHGEFPRECPIASHHAKIMSQTQESSVECSGMRPSLPAIMQISGRRSGDLWRMLLIQRGHSANVVGPLKRAGIVTPALAHTALHLCDGFVSCLPEPMRHAIEHDA